MEHGQSHGAFENSEIFWRCMGVVEIFFIFVSFWFFTDIPVSAREHAVSLLISDGGDFTQTTCGIFLNFKCSESRTNFLLHKKQFCFCSQNFGLIMSRKRKDRPSFFHFDPNLPFVCTKCKLTATILGQPQSFKRTGGRGINRFDTQKHLKEDFLSSLHFSSQSSQSASQRIWER